MSNHLLSSGFYLVLSLVIIQGCSTKMAFEKKTSFNIEKAYYTLWISGVKGGGSSIDVTIKLSENNPLKPTIFIRGLYFKDAYIALSEKEPLLISGRMRNTLNNQGFESESQDINPPKFEKKDSPFNTLTLKPNEGVLHYVQNNKDKYYKIILQKKEVTGIPM